MKASKKVVTINNIKAKYILEKNIVKKKPICYNHKYRRIEKMEKNKKTQVIAIVALVIGIVGLSIGFAAFSSVLNIQTSADVKPDSSTMNVDFSSAEDKVEIAEITPVATPNTLTTTNGVIDNSGDPTILNLSATFTEPGQSVVYKFYAYNAGELKAYLKSIVFGNVAGQNTTKVCTAAEGTTNALVQKACEKISVKVKVGNELETSTGKASITGHDLAKGTGELVTVTLEYEAGAERADGNFTVSFGDITLNYSSAD